MIIRTVKNKENPYFMLNRAAVNDARLSYKAVGIHTYLMSKPDEWEANEIDIVKRHKEGRTAVRSAISELRKYGYMHRYQPKDENNLFAKARIDTYETPEMNPFFTGELTDEDAELPESDFPEDETPVSENRTAGTPVSDFPLAGNLSDGKRTLVINELVNSDSKENIVASASLPQQPISDSIQEGEDRNLSPDRSTLQDQEIAQQQANAPLPQVAAAPSPAKQSKRKKALSTPAEKKADEQPEQTPHGALWEALFYITHMHKDYKLATKEMSQAIGKTAKKLIELGYTIEDLRAWWSTVWTKEFPGMQKIDGVQKIFPAKLNQVTSGIARIKKDAPPQSLQGSGNASTIGMTTAEQMAARMNVFNKPYVAEK